jgi:uncharacterized protein (DUF2252 family)
MRQLPGPWEWDVKRLAASFEVAGRDLGFAPSDRRVIVTGGVQEYRERMRKAAGMRTLDAWYEHMNVDQVARWISDEVRKNRLTKKEQKRAVQTCREGADPRQRAGVCQAGWEEWRSATDSS